MTVGAQVAALPLQLEATLPAAAPGAPAADLFGGLVAALAATVIKPVAAGAVALPSADAPTIFVDPTTEAALPDADQLIALTCAMPAQAQLLVRKPGAAIAGQKPQSEGSESETAESQATCGFDAASLLPVVDPIAPAPVAEAPVSPASNGPTPVALTPAAPAPAAPGAAAQIAVVAAPAALTQTRKSEAGQPASAQVELAPVQPDGAAKSTALSPETVEAMRAPSADPVREALRAVLAQALPAATKHSEAKAPSAPALSPELKTAPLFTPSQFLAPEIAPRGHVAVETALPIGPDTSELIIERQLDLAAGDEWLDDLAKDIVRSAGDAPLRFRLNPENLGSLRVEIATDRGGTAVRLTTETETARAIIADAQPRLIAEARAQGLRISEAHVDLGQQPGSDANRRHAEGAHEPQLRTARSVQDEGDRDGKPTRGKSERYA